jgi:hypothetical protein
LPELPDFLRPDPSTPRPIRPIQDIDLPDGASVIQPDEEAEIIENKPFKEEEGKKKLRRISLLDSNYNFTLKLGILIFKLKSGM